MARQRSKSKRTCGACFSKNIKYCQAINIPKANTSDDYFAVFFFFLKPRSSLKEQNRTQTLNWVLECHTAAEWIKPPFVMLAFHIRVQVLPVTLPIPANELGKQGITARVLGRLPPMQETWMEFWFWPCLAWQQVLQSFREWTGMGALCLSLSLCVILSNKYTIIK